MLPRPDLLDDKSPAGLEVFQLTTEADVPASHLYMEAQVFTPDSQRLVLHRSATAHGGEQDDPEHRYLLCDLENGGALSPLTDELGATAPSVSPDGEWAYYFVDRTEVNGGSLTLKRVRLHGGGRETILVADGPLPGTSVRPRRIYPLSTISSDGARIALSCFLGDGVTENAPWGLMVFDIEQATVELILSGPSWCNMHPQYSRALDPPMAPPPTPSPPRGEGAARAQAMSPRSHDILIQENHGNTADATGVIGRLTGGAGADIHVIRDDGSDFRDLPWGRDGNEFCQGHQCWRGRSQWAITSTWVQSLDEAQLIESLPAPEAGHLGASTPGGLRNTLSHEFPKPAFYHFATDIAGRRFITDCGRFDPTMAVYAAEFGEPGKDALRNWTYLLTARSTCAKTTHIHPFLSPDGTMGFFNSDESGVLQAYMVRGF